MPPSSAPPSRKHRIALAAAIACAAVAALPVAGLEGGGTAWLHLAVDEAPPAGSTIRVNLPLSLVEAALALVQEGEARRAQVVFDDAEVSLAELEERWHRLGRRSGPLLTVEEDHRLTIVSRRGDELVIESTDRRWGTERVEVRIAAPVVDALFSGAGARLDLAAAVRAMATAGAGEVTAISDDGDRLRLWVDGSPDQPARAASRSRSRR